MSTINLAAEIRAAQMREATRAEAARLEAEIREERARLQREESARRAFAELMGETYLSLITGFDHDPENGRAWPLLSYEGRMYAYHWHDRIDGIRRHCWVRDDKARMYFGVDVGPFSAERRRDQALVALAECAALPAPKEEEEEED